MNIIIIGMRRSGTTILFDCLYEDKRFDSYYEPFCHGKINIGGGSGEKQIPYGEKINNARREFIWQKKLDISPEYFNLGAPQKPEMEFEKRTPLVHREYLSFIATKNEHTLMKFVRVSHKVETLHKLFPDARIIHIVRDPRRMAMSHIFGKNRKASNSMKAIKLQLLQAMKRRRFFYLKTGFNNWSSEKLINYFITSCPKYANFENSPSYEKIMLLWKVLYDKTREDCLDFFGSNYLELRHEDLCTKPIHTMEVIYDFLKMRCDEVVKDWSRSHVKRTKPIYRVHDKRWLYSAQKLSIDLSYWNDLNE